MTKDTPADPDNPTMGITRSLARSTAIMATGTLISRIAGFGRIVAVVYALGAGTGKIGDPYNLANQAPNIVYELVLGGVLSATLVPVFVQHFSGENEEDGWKAVSAVLSISVTLLVALVAAIAIASPWIIDLYSIGSHKPDLIAQRQVATYLLRLFAPQVAFYGFISVATAVLQAKRRFGPPMFAPILNNVTVICTLVALPQITGDLSLQAMQHDRVALTFLGLGTTAGVAAMAALFVPYLRSLSGTHLKLVWQPRHPAVGIIPAPHFLRGER